MLRLPVLARTAAACSVRRIAVIRTLQYTTAAPGAPVGGRDAVITANPRTLAALTSAGAVPEVNPHANDITVDAAKRSHEALEHVMGVVRKHGPVVSGFFSDQLRRGSHVSEKLQRYAGFPDYDAKRLGKILEAGQAVITGMTNHLEHPVGDPQMTEFFRNELRDALGRGSDVLAEASDWIQEKQ